MSETIPQTVEALIDRIGAFGNGKFGAQKNDGQRLRRYCESLIKVIS